MNKNPNNTRALNLNTGEDCSPDMDAKFASGAAMPAGGPVCSAAKVDVTAENCPGSDMPAAASLTHSGGRLTDEQLVLQARSGNKDASETLMHRYKDTVRAKAHLYFMLGGDVEDIVQEGMIGLFKSISSYSEDRNCSFRTFADLCINRQIITAIKQAGRLKYSPLNSSVSLDKPVSDKSDTSKTLGESLTAGLYADPEAALILNEMTELIMSPDSRLLSSFERRVMFMLVDGKGYTEIAAELGKSPKSIDNAIQRIRQKLKQFITTD